MKIGEMLNEDGSPKQIEGWLPLYSAFYEDVFLGRWVSPCQEFAIQDDVQGILNLVPLKEAAQQKFFQRHSFIEGTIEEMINIYHEVKNS